MPQELNRGLPLMLAKGSRDSTSFPSFRLDRRNRSLTRDGISVAFRRKTWGVLLYLAEQPVELVTREQLLDAVWPDIAVTPSTPRKSSRATRRSRRPPRTPRCIGFPLVRGTGSLLRTSNVAGRAQAAIVDHI